MAEKKRKIPKKKRVEDAVGKDTQKAVEFLEELQNTVVDEEEIAELTPSEEDQAKFLEAYANDEVETADDTKGLGAFFYTPVIQEIMLNIAASTPTKDFANSLVKFFEDHPKAVVTVKSIGAGASHTLLKASIEANKLLLPKGKMLSRFDFWTNDKGKSVNNTRFILVDILPHSLATALTGHNVEYHSIDGFSGKGDKVHEQ